MAAGALAKNNATGAQALVDNGATGLQQLKKALSPQQAQPFIPGQPTYGNYFGNMDAQAFDRAAQGMGAGRFLDGPLRASNMRGGLISMPAVDPNAQPIMQGQPQLGLLDNKGGAQTTPPIAPIDWSRLIL